MWLLSAAICCAESCEGGDSSPFELKLFSLVVDESIQLLLRMLL